MTTIRNRVRELRTVRAGELVPNARNWRTHPAEQVDALKAVLSEVGYASALLARELPDGRLELLDGHLRAGVAPEAMVPVLVLDVDETEAAKILLTHDPIAAMAETSTQQLQQLLADVEFSKSDALENLLADLESQAAAPFTLETVDIATLKRHPRNYRQHPPEQLEHLKASIREHGLYRRIIVARDGTILAGHGIAQAATELGIVRIPVARLPLEPDDPRALKLLAGDNEVSLSAEVDDRALTELLKEILESSPGGLTGTGFDESQLCALVYTTRPEHEIVSKNDSAEWLGLPAYSSPDDLPRLIVSFADEQDRARFVEQSGLEIRKTVRKVQSAFWPNKPREVLSAVEFAESESHA